MAAPYRPMLPSPAPEPPDGKGSVHEAKLDGFRSLVQVKIVSGAVLVPAWG
jgi:hypothetical protein